MGIFQNIKAKFYKNEMLKHSSYFMFGQICLQLSSLIALPITTRLLSPSEYGTLSIFYSMSTIFTLILSLNFGTAIVRYYHEERIDTKELSDFLVTLARFSCLFCLVALGADLIFLKAIPKVYQYALFASAPSVFIGFYLQYLMTSQQSKKNIIVSVVYRYITLPLMFVMMYLLPSEKYLGQVYVLLVGNCLYALYAFFSMRKILFCGKFAVKHLKYAFLFSIPLLPYSLSGIVIAQFDRVMIAYYNGNVSAGLYALAYNIGALISIFFLTTNKAWVPIFLKEMKEKNEEKIWRMQEIYIKLIFVLSLLLIIATPVMLKLFSSSKYSAALGIIPIIIIGYDFYFLFLLFGLYAHERKRFWYLTFISISAALLNILLNMYALPHFGYMAGAFTTLVTFVVMFVLQYYSAKKLLKCRVISGKKLLKLCVLLLFLCVVYYAINYGISNATLKYFCHGGLVILSIGLFFPQEVKRLFCISRDSI